MPKMPEYLDKWVVNVLLVGFSVAVPVALVVGPGFFERADGVSSRVPFHKESAMTADTRDDASWISLLLRLAHIERSAARAQSPKPKLASPKEVAPRLGFSFLESPKKPIAESSSTIVNIVRPARPIQPISAEKTLADEPTIAATRQSVLRSIGTTVQVEPKAIKAPTPTAQTPTAQTAKPSTARKTVPQKTVAPRRVSSSQQIRPVVTNAQPAATQPSQPLPALLDETQTASVMQTPIGRPRAERPDEPSASSEDKPKAPASPPPASVPPKPTPPAPPAPTPPEVVPPAPPAPRPEPITPPAQPSPPAPVSPPIREPLPPIRPPELPSPPIPVRPELPKPSSPSLPKPEEPKPPKNQEPKPPKAEDPKPPKKDDPKPPKDDPKPPKDGLIPRTAHDLLPILFK